MTPRAYRAKYKRLGVCVCHPHVKAVPGHIHCEACMEKRHKGGKWYNDGGRSSVILGIRVNHRLLRRVL
jgi:hypothetical protein